MWGDFYVILDNNCRLEVANPFLKRANYILGGACTFEAETVLGMLSRKGGGTQKGGCFGFCDALSLPPLHPKAPPLSPTPGLPPADLSTVPCTPIHSLKSGLR